MHTSIGYLQVFINSTCLMKDQNIAFGTMNNLWLPLSNKPHISPQKVFEGVIIKHPNMLWIRFFFSLFELLVRIKTGPARQRKTFKHFLGMAEVTFVVAGADGQLQNIIVRLKRSFICVWILTHFFSIKAGFTLKQGWNTIQKWPESLEVSHFGGRIVVLHIRLSIRRS